MSEMALRLIVPPPVRVLLGESQSLVRAGLRALLEDDPGISVVGEAGSGDEATALGERLDPDVVLLDLAIAGLDSVTATARICAVTGSTVLLLVDSEADERIVLALLAGASGTVLRDTEPRELARAVQLAARGEMLLTPDLTRRLISELGKEPEPPAGSSEGLEDLTAREREVTALAARGLTNEEIAERLSVSPATAKTHISRAMVKLRVHDRAQLVAFAYETGFVLARA
jgi:DNA-binding NarL/FixJ family response regulator